MNINDVQMRLSQLFLFSQDSRKVVLIRTPLLYPDGEPVDIYLSEKRDVLSDLGRTYEYIRTHIPQKGVNQDKLREQIQKIYGVQFENGVFFLPVTNVNALALGIFRLANASVLYVAVVIGQP